MTGTSPEDQAKISALCREAERLEEDALYSSKGHHAARRAAGVRGANLRRSGRPGSLPKTAQAEIAQAEGLNPGRASTIARLAHLAPDVVKACLIRNGSLPLDWQQPRMMIQARN